METPDDVRAARAGMGTPAPGGSAAPGSDQDVQQLKVEISETQAELQQTVAEIQERLSPSHLKDQAAGAVRDATIGRMQHMMNRAGESIDQATDTTREAASRVSSGLRNNPVPVALIAIGAAWLIANNRSSRRWSADGNWDDESWDENANGYESPTARGAYGSSEYGEYGEASYATSGSTWHRQEPGADTSARRTGAVDRAQQLARRARSRWQSMMEDNPVALGIAALAAGALVGAAFPSTHVESRYMGPARDSVLESARDMAKHTVEKVAGDEGTSPAPQQRV
jgi:hypothetical protein